MTIHITCSTDNNYVQHCSAMLCSVLENNKKHHIVTHFLHHGLTDHNKEILTSQFERYQGEIRFYDIKVSQLGNVTIAKNHPNLSVAAYYRLMLPSLLDDSINRILYLDCDIIVLQDLSKLYSFDLEGYGVACVQDATPLSDQHRSIMGLQLGDTAFCSGIMMINLHYWRCHNSQEAMLKYANVMAGKLIMEDQDVLNHEFRGHWIKLPYKWGRTPLSVAPVDTSQKRFDIIEFVNSPCIIHYAAHVKPWLDVWFPLQEHYWKYVHLSGFPNPQKTHANRDLRIKIYKSVIRYLVNKNVRPFIPDFVELICKDILYIVQFVINAFSPSRFKLLMLKRWCQKYGV